MRRGFLNMFPDVQNVTTPTPGNPITTEDDKQKKPQGPNTKQEISVFAKADKNSNTTVTSQEAKNWDNSIFGQAADLSQVNFNYENETAKNEIMSKAGKKFGNVAEKFNKAVDKNFKISNLVAKLQAVNGKIGEENVETAKDTAQKGLDAQVTNTAASVSRQVNADILREYMDTISQVQAQYEKEHPQTPEEPTADGTQGTEGADGKDGTDGTQTKNPDDNSKTKTTVYSTYDNSPTNERVNYSEMQSKMKYNNRVQIMSNDANIQNQVESKFGGKLDAVGQQRFEQALANFDKDIGSINIKGDDAGKIKEAAAKLDQKAESAANKASQKANQEINAKLQKEVNSAVAKAMTGGTEETPDSSAEKPPEKGAPKNSPRLGQKWQPGQGWSAFGQNGGNSPFGFNINLNDKGGGSVDVLGLKFNIPGSTETNPTEGDTSSDTGKTQEYTVKKGDNLSKIAKQHNVKLKDLIAANPQIKNPELIHPNDKIKIPQK